MLHARPAFILALLAATLAAVISSACSTTVKVRGTEDTPVIGKTEVELTLQAGPPCTVYADETPTLPKGSCVHLAFSGADGKPTGSSDTTVGGEGVEVPPGTESVTVTACDPKTEKAVSGLGTLFFYRTIPVDVSRGQGRFVDFTVRANDRLEADRMAAEFLEMRSSKPCPRNVETFGNFIVRFQHDGSAFFVLTSPDCPKALDFRWNGRRIARLSDAKVLSRNGWYFTIVRLPSTLVNFSPLGSSNDLEYTLTSNLRVVKTSTAVEVKL